MRVYVLEDDPERIVTLCRFFDRVRPSDYLEVQWSQTCFRRHEFKPPYDLILLDHDLGGRQMREHEDCGMTFLKSIFNEIGNALVIVHSHNAGAAMRMKQAYRPLVLAPYNSVEFWSLLDRIVRT